MATLEYDEAGGDDMLEDTAEVQPAPRLRSKVTAVRKQKGRGFAGEAMEEDEPTERRGGRYDILDGGSGPGPQKCASRCGIECVRLKRHEAKSCCSAFLPGSMLQ